MRPEPPDYHGTGSKVRGDRGATKKTHGRENPLAPVGEVCHWAEAELSFVEEIFSFVEAELSFVEELAEVSDEELVEGASLVSLEGLLSLLPLPLFAPFFA
jgi:hypothetical protein